MSDIPNPTPQEILDPQKKDDRVPDIGPVPDPVIEPPGPDLPPIKEPDRCQRFSAAHSLSRSDRL
jgi:hypothetical protein